MAVKLGSTIATEVQLRPGKYVAGVSITALQRVLDSFGCCLCRTICGSLLCAASVQQHMQPANHSSPVASHGCGQCDVWLDHRQ